MNKRQIIVLWITITLLVDITAFGFLEHRKIFVKDINKWAGRIAHERFLNPDKPMGRIKGLKLYEKVVDEAERDFIQLKYKLTYGIIIFSIISLGSLSVYNYKRKACLQGKNMSKKPLLMLCLCLLLSGCATVPTTLNLYKDNLTFPTRDPKEVKVFRQIPDDIDFIKLAEVTVDKARDWKAAEKGLKKEAAKIGADAVYIVDTETTQKSFIMPYGGSFIGGSAKRMSVTGIAIKYKSN